MTTTTNAPKMTLTREAKALVKAIRANVRFSKFTSVYIDSVYRSAECDDWANRPEWRNRFAITDAIYGLSYALNTGRVSGTLHIAIRKLTPRQTVELIAQMAVEIGSIREASGWLIQNTEKIVAMV